MIQLILVSLLGLSAQAKLLNSNLEARHQDLIAAAVFEKCGLEELVQTSLTEELFVVDSGIIDRTFQIEFMAQGSAGQYRVLVRSSYSDHYDHNSKNWGAYSVQLVQCQHD